MLAKYLLIDPFLTLRFNDGGYLYAYLCYLTPETCLLLVSTVRLSEKFYELANWKNKIDKVQPPLLDAYQSLGRGRKEDGEDICLTQLSWSALTYLRECCTTNRAYGPQALSKPLTARLCDRTTEWPPWAYLG